LQAQTEEREYVNVNDCMDYHGLDRRRRHRPAVLGGMRYVVALLACRGAA
jgi:hypothetical protein